MCVTVQALQAVIVVLAAGTSAEAPLNGYTYPAPSAPLSGSGIINYPPVVINNGIAANSNNGYVSPSLLVASPPPALANNYPTRYSNDYQDADVHKHVYVHVAPEEPAEQQAPLVVNAQRKPKKHYKIVFIKTPSALPPSSAYVNVPQPDQEKTLIYVLSKKPDLQQSLVLSTPAPTQPAKPEVFFIRYKTNEAKPQNQVAYQGGQVVNGGNVLGGGNGVKPLTNSYGVPLGAPLNSATYSRSDTTAADGTYNTV
ncbi:Oxoglutarate dehydrogenase [Frankliniella fusca]|uniref:Oxoglutarate dehydrogenase n=1 Tax=Frankliniella fusca TaxID=407009 RepID=A0AAE1LC14_9NEOP|nr:Oxoglutarate dehydrogenase [Frankliniella fusca]